MGILKNRTMRFIALLLPVGTLPMLTACTGDFRHPPTVVGHLIPARSSR
jgi:hypothetical protein